MTARWLERARLDYEQQGETGTSSLTAYHKSSSRVLLTSGR